MTFIELKVLERSFLHLLRRSRSRRELGAALNVIAEELGRSHPSDDWFGEGLRVIHETEGEPEDCLWATMLFAASYYRDRLNGTG